MNAIVIGIGTELTTGQTIDTNSAQLSRELARRGIDTDAHWTLPDDREAVAEALAAAARRADLVLVSGGLGPTADDLTRHALADAMGVELVLDEQCLAEIEAFFRRRGREMAEVNRIQAMLPAGAEAIPNAAGTAPGIAARLGGAAVYSMPGVPHEMKRMFAEEIAGRLPRQQSVIVSRVVHTFGTGESNIGAQIADLMARGADPTVGTSVKAGLISIRIHARGETVEQADALADETIAEIRRRLGELVVGEGNVTLASAVGRALRARKQTLATAESCTGGLVGQMITGVPGASDYYLGGVICYANAVKRNALGVGEELLREHGAVSEPVARAMADGCRRTMGADWAIAITGIAGPTGSSPDKPVGLTYIALAGPVGTDVGRHVFPGDRTIVRRRAAATALNGLRLALRGA